MGRVRIGTCSGPAEAALVRAAFDAHDIHVFINAEHHASVLGGLGGAFVPLHIMVDEADAEEAAALLAELRAQEHGGDDADDDAADAPAEDSAESHTAEAHEVDDDAEVHEVDRRVERRRRTGVALLVGLCVTFGTAHMSTGAWLRGLVLAGVEGYAIKMVAVGIPYAWVVLVATIATDLTGALLRIHGDGARLPPARVRR